MEDLVGGDLVGSERESSQLRFFSDPDRIPHDTVHRDYVLPDKVRRHFERIRALRMDAGPAPG